MDSSKIISGHKIAREITNRLKNEITDLKNDFSNFKPCLSILQVGNREDSNVYIRMKIKSAEEIGISIQHIRMPRSVSQTEILEKVKQLNNSENVHGIIIQMPLDTDSLIDNRLVINSVHTDKDVDGLHTLNQGKICTGDLSGFIPCTPHGIQKLIESTGVTIDGSKAVIVGRSSIVGSPVAELLKWKNATISVCHSKTKNLAEECRLADILVVAIGKPEFIRGDWIKPGAVVIDCGITSVKDSSQASGKRLVGDVNFEEALKVVSYITPVPGGVGPMTVAMLMSNTVNSAKRFVEKLSLRKFSNSWNIQPLNIFPKKPVPSDIDISKQQKPKKIQVLAQEIGLNENEVTLYGNKKIKVSLSVLQRLQKQKSGKYVVITGVTPTSNGEGKSTTTIGLAQALCIHRRLNTIACIRQPSQGPTFGIKGGAAGGGYSQVIPMEELNLHLTGDIHAITSANNLLAAQIDARIFHEKTQSTEALFKRLTTTKTGSRFTEIQLRRLNRLGIKKEQPSQLTAEEIEKFSRLNIDESTIVWNRVIDTNDRFLRKIQIGKGVTEKGMIRDTSFSIAVASEIMAILSLARDYSDLKNRLSQIVVAFDTDGNEVTADDLGVTGALMVLIKDVFEPNLMQSLEGSPVFIHTGPFANIAHGCSSIIADEIALKLVGDKGYVLTEAGFGSDIGLEKFFNIKCRNSGIMPDAIVLVTTVRALKMHGEYAIHDGKKDSQNFLVKGVQNLEKHIQNGIKYGVPVVVAINKYVTDTHEEIEFIRQTSFTNGAFGAVVCRNWNYGGLGAVDLADKVVLACQSQQKPKFLYSLNHKIEDKIKIIATQMYGASYVIYSDKVLKILEKYYEKGYDNMPICIAKTALSLTDNPEIKGAPKGFSIHVNDMFLFKGAGFIVAVTGEISLMPGLPTRPAIYDIDLNLENMEIVGMF